MSLHASLPFRYSESSQPEEHTFAPKIKVKPGGSAGGTGGDRINRLYQAGKEREMARLQKEDSVKEAEVTLRKTYDERMGFGKKKKEMSSSDLVTKGARTNALYMEAQMRAQKKREAAAKEAAHAEGATFQPKLATKKSSRVMTSMGGSSESSSDRMYKKAEEQRRKLDAKREATAYSDHDTFTPDISKSQENCEAASLGAARPMALFMQGEILRAKREEMAEQLVDGKEIDELTFTPAVNYRYNDELLGHDESTFDERLYRTDFTGSQAHEELMQEERLYVDEECTFAPETTKLAGHDDDTEVTGDERINRLYGDSAKIAEKREEIRRAEEEKAVSQKIKISAKARQMHADDDGGLRGKASDRLFGSWSKSLEKKEKAEVEAAKPKASFMPKLFTSRKSRQSVGDRDTKTMYEAGKSKLSSREQAQRDAEAAREAAELAALKSPEYATRKKKSEYSGRDLLGEALSLGDDDLGSVDGMNPLSRRMQESTDSVASSVAPTDPAAKAAKSSALRGERTSALQNKASELLAKRAAAKAAREAAAAE